jgi:hypothetical protein
VRIVLLSSALVTSPTPRAAIALFRVDIREPRLKGAAIQKIMRGEGKRTLWHFFHLRDSLDSVGHSGTPSMRILEKTARFGAIALAVLFIGLSLCGVFGAWFVNRKATDVALKGFGVIEIGVGVVDAGVGRVNDLIAKSLTEVRQAAETIGTVGAQAQANSPVLNALSQRLETSLAPRASRRCSRCSLLYGMRWEPWATQ